jgi:2-polyprenyl-6-methoxyphenol hydroxylase-like FAD-dependent oxidoreductase
VYCYCDGPVASPPPPLRELLAGYAEPVPTLLDALDEAGNSTTYAGAVEEVVLDSWSHGAVLLIGDAAHATSPNMAQGAATALEDAIVLAECLTAAGIANGITVYERRRRPRTQWVLRQAHHRDRTRTLLPAVRNRLLKHFGKRIFHSNYRPLREPA